MDFTPPPEPACLLVDNGSLQPAATRALRGLAAALAQRIGVPVAPVSLLHSNKIAAAELDGEPAEVLETALRQRLAAGTRRFLVVPLFFGPSAALTDYIPGRVKLMTTELGPFELTCAAPVAGTNVTDPDPRIARIVADQVRTVLRERGLRRPVVILVDHGSPQRAVAVVRDVIARQLAAELGNEAGVVVASSMERRSGVEFDFNEPLVERALADTALRDGAGDVVVAPLFFSRGRHAGPGGDIESMARAAEARHPGLRVHFAALVGEHPQLIDVLEDRWRDGAGRK